MKRVCVKILQAVLLALFGAVLAVVTISVLFVNNKPDLAPWHTVVLENEFTAQSGVETLDEYRLLEDRLFNELQQKIVDSLPAKHRSKINRYTAGSLSDPARWPINWNRTYELQADNPPAGVLMLHGLSDSPYSLRLLAKDLNDAGAWVVGLRVPGHGTIPSGLTDIRWEDMAAAVRIAVLHLKQRLGDRPVHIVGYSNGAALAVEYALNALDDAKLPPPGRLVLISPAIGITPFAGFAVWQARLGSLLGLEKLQWSSVVPEYDPYKYQSFAINAGDLTHRLTGEIQELMNDLKEEGRLDAFPPTLAFLSAVDATVSTHAVLVNLFMKLRPNQHELVVFDLNRREGVDPLFTTDPKDALEGLLDDDTLPFKLGVISNANRGDNKVALRINAVDSQTVAEEVLDLAWPPNMYSLSHVALPFPPTDPLYGGPEAETSPGVALGNVALRGEKDTLAVPASEMLRQRWNPFYSYLEERTESFVLP